MKKYNSRTIYKGNLIKNIEGQKVLYKENELLLYDECKDVFYSYINTFNLFLSRDLEMLNNKELEEIQKKIDKYTYSYKDSDIYGEVYVEESSIDMLINNKKSRN